MKMMSFAIEIHHIDDVEENMDYLCGLLEGVVTSDLKRFAKSVNARMDNLAWVIAKGLLVPDDKWVFGVEQD
jgi:hypothetical protein